MKQDLPTRSICRFIAILKVINRLGPVSLLTIAKAIDIPYPTVSRVVQTLLENELVERVASTKCFRASGKTLSLSSGFAMHDLLAAVAHQQMVAMTGRIGWPLALATRVGSSMVVRDSTHHLTSLAFSGCPIGFKVPLLESAAGHVCLSHMPDEERECVLSGLDMLDGPSPMMALFKSGSPIARMREDGFATYERGQRSLDPGKISSIAVPILDGNRCAGVLTLMFFASAMPVAEAIRRYLGDLRATAAGIAAKLRQEQEAAIEAALAVAVAAQPAVSPAKKAATGKARVQPLSRRVAPTLPETVAATGPGRVGAKRAVPQQPETSHSALTDALRAKLRMARPDASTFDYYSAIETLRRPCKVLTYRPAPHAPHRSTTQTKTLKAGA